MAYAKLIFPTGLTAVKKLKDIARFCAGESNLSNFEFIDKINSEIVVIEPFGWSMVSSLSALEAPGTATRTEYCLQTTSTSGKTVYGALSTRALTNGGGMGVWWGSGTSFTIGRPTTSATDAALICAVGTGIDAVNSTIANKSYDLKNFTTATSGSTFAFISAITGTVQLNANTYYVRVTSSCLMIIGSMSTEASIAFTSILEFPETDHTIRNALTPYMTYSGCYGNMDPYNSGATSWNGSTNSINLGNSSPSFGIHAHFTNWTGANNTLLSLTPAVINLQTASRYVYGLVNSPSLTVDSSGNSCYSLVPIIGNRTSLNEGFHDYSSYSKVYQSYWSTGDYSAGNELTVGTDTYVLACICSAAASPKATYSRQLAIKKA